MAEVFLLSLGGNMTLDFLSTLGADQLKDRLSSFLADSGSYLPASLGISSSIQFALMVIALTIGCGFVFRVFFGKRCSANQAVSASIGILFIYTLTVFIYSLNPLDLSKYLSPLPFAIFRTDILIILPFGGAERSLICSHILSLIILCFIIHFLDFVLPTGKSFFSWLLLRCLSIVMAIFLNLAVNLAINIFLPDVLAIHAPGILLALLGAALIIGLFNPLLCIVFTVVNPVVGLLYTFFFSNAIGKQLTKAVISATILCILFLILEYLGYTVIDISSSAVLGYLPISGILLLLWFIFDYKF